MAEELLVQIRGEHGKRRSRRLRKSGSIPAVLYGHGETPVSLAVATDAFDAVLRHGARMVALTGAVEESALIREVQWDTWGGEVLHIDFTRVSAHEKVEVRVALELRGEAPGVHDGGIVEQVMHDVVIFCPAAGVPEKIEVNVNALRVGDSFTVADLQLPEGATVLADGEEVVVHCVEPVEAPEEEAVEAEPGEPEVIGEKKAEEEAGE
ncbi:MAG: 50S ribosomal protein L25 [Thermoguttaceae bacterium]|jgi:large subunit ribosomal protein L25|nr:50S ribosomal protein L25 [Thermoguttaceae bacterium]